MYEDNDHWPGFRTGCGEFVPAASAHIFATTLDRKNLPPGVGGDIKVHHWVVRVEARIVEAVSVGTAAIRVCHGEAVRATGIRVCFFLQEHGTLLIKTHRYIQSSGCNPVQSPK
jgi:hypothetical protein